MSWQCITALKVKRRMEQGLINYIRTYEAHVYTLCLEDDWTEYEGGNGRITKTFSTERFYDLDCSNEIIKEYIAYKNGATE